MTFQTGQALSETFFDCVLEGCFDAITPAFSLLSESHQGHKDFVCPCWNFYSRLFCDKLRNKLAQAHETALMSLRKRNAHSGNES